MLYRKQSHKRKILVKKKMASIIHVCCKSKNQTTNILIGKILMYLVRVLEGHKPPGWPVERGLPLHGKRRESVGAFSPFICGLKKSYSQQNVSLFLYLVSLFFLRRWDIIIMHREWDNCKFVDTDKALQYIFMLN